MSGFVARRAVGAALLTAAVVLVAPAPAWSATGAATGTATPTGPTATAKYLTTSAPVTPAASASMLSNGLVGAGAGASSGGSSAPSGPPPYTYVAVPNGTTPGMYVFPNQSGTGRMAALGGNPVHYFLPCSTSGLGCPSPAASPGPSAPPVSPIALAITAIDHASFPAATIQTSPPVGKAVVNFRTWVKVTNWAPVVASASAGPVTSTVTATPTTLTLSAPDSHSGGAFYHTITATCAGPGKAYDASIPFAAQHSPCELTWAWPSFGYGHGYGDSYPLTVAVTYHVTWTAAGAAGGGALPDVTHTTTFPFLVREIQVLGVPTS